MHNKTVKNKFDDKSLKGILVGYLPNGYKIWNPKCKRYVVVRDVVVDETDFLRSRPTLELEGNDAQNFQDKTDVSDVSKSVSKESHCNDNSELDVNKSNKSDVSKSDIQIPSNNKSDKSK